MILHEAPKHLMYLMFCVFFCSTTLLHSFKNAKLQKLKKNLSLIKQKYLIHLEKNDYIQSNDSSRKISNKVNLLPPSSDDNNILSSVSGHNKYYSPRAT